MQREKKLNRVQMENTKYKMLKNLLVSAKAPVAKISRVWK